MYFLRGVQIYVNIIVIFTYNLTKHHFYSINCIIHSIKQQIINSYISFNYKIINLKKMPIFVVN